jgi:hypothetical protein
MKNTNVLFILFATMLSVTACKKTSLKDLKVNPAPANSPLSAPMTQTLGRFKMQDRISWRHDGVIEVGGASTLHTSGYARVYLNHYNPDVTIDGPVNGIKISALGQSHRCVAGHCREDQLFFQNRSGGIHEIFDNGTFRFSDGITYDISLIDSTFRCNPKPDSVECQVMTVD